MTFVHGYLLGGLVLVGVPVLLHLIMRQKPRQLPFPAFRFLRQRHLINQRKLRLQHLLLLLLRMGLIAAVCLALSRPRIFSQDPSTGTDQAVSAAFVFDTSYSMEYTVAGVSRLDEARQRARELLDEIAPDGSQLAVFDTGDAGADTEDWIPTRDLVLARINALQLRPTSAPVTRPIERALRLLQAAGEVEEPLPRFLYVFSDRTRECWNAAEAKKLQVPPGVNVVFVDVGVAEPRDLAIEGVVVDPPVVAPGEPYEVRVAVRATGADYDNEITCQLENEPDPDRLPDKQPLKRLKGESKEVVFSRKAPERTKDGVREVPYQVVVKLGTNDALPFNNVHYATFLVREKRKVLTIADRPTAPRGTTGSPWIWERALSNAPGLFEGELKSTGDAENLTPRDLSAYKLVCLFEVAKPSPGLWQKLEGFVRKGGGLVIVPGGEEILDGLEEFNKNGTAVGLLPATLRELITVPAKGEGVPWARFSGRHPLTAPFQEWSRNGNPDFDVQELRPQANRYWSVEPGADPTKSEGVIANFNDEPRRPALVEGAVGQGKVMLFTSPLDGRTYKAEGQGNRPWHNYWSDSSFGLVLVDQVCRYLAGDSTRLAVNYLSGQPPVVALGEVPEKPYTLQGPGLTAAEARVEAGDDSNRVVLPQAVAPGNYAVYGGKGRMAAGFSLNIRPEEGQLEQVPAEEIEAALGKGSLLAVGRTVSLRDALQSHWKPPVELLPWLMVAVLLVLTVESVLGNRFYRRRDQTEGAPEEPRPLAVAPSA
jgi:hypothetical protein